MKKSENSLGGRRWRAGATVLALLFVASACDGAAPAAEEARDPVTHLTASEAREVLARVGPRTITLGDYATTLARMAPFERLRYQTPERQKQLLDEMIDLELLAQEARRRGLDKKPEVALALAQALRDEVLDDLRRSLPTAESLSEREVRDYYEAHRSEFQEPERRRALLLVVASAEEAVRLAASARTATAAAWGELVRKHSLERRGTAEQDALEWSGDFGFVSAPGQERGQNADIPEAVRARLFGLKALGDVAEPVQVGSRHYVVRLGGTSPARERSQREADRTIRIELLRQRYLEKERALEQELRQKFPVVVDERALASAASPAPQP